MVEDGERVINKWSPDTCLCVLNYSWIRGSSENGREHTYEGHDRKCHDHGDLMEHHLYNTVLEENQRKNITFQHALDTHPQKLARQIARKDGTKVNIKKEDLDFSFFFTGQAPDRILNVTFSEPLDEMEKRAIEDRFPGKVKVH